MPASRQSGIFDKDLNVLVVELPDALLDLRHHRAGGVDERDAVPARQRVGGRRLAVRADQDGLSREPFEIPVRHDAVIVHVRIPARVPRRRARARR